MRVRDLHRFFVYHSPQYPGYTCWCGLWIMPDGSAMGSFTQATGPVLGRPRAPEPVRRALVWPPPEHREEYDMTGLLLENVHLRSVDLGRTWSLAGSDPFRTCMNGITGEAEVALPDRTLVRGVWGRYLPYDDVPQDGYLQRSADLGRTWSGPEQIQQDPGLAFWPKRLRVLRDGRVLAGGGLFRRHPEGDIRTRWCDDFVPALYVSDDDGRTWHGPIPVVPEEQGADFAFTEEFDWVELEDGDLLLVLRAGVQEGRLQARLRRRGTTWETVRVERNGLPYSGHPELLLTREGCLLHVATTGIACSLDQGSSWQDLPLEDGLAELRREPATPYYPKAVQLGSGEVLVVGHVGGDDAYGCVDQSIVGLRFTLSA
jgi:hypothetical protein